MSTISLEHMHPSPEKKSVCVYDLTDVIDVVQSFNLIGEEHQIFS